MKKVRKQLWKQIAAWTLVLALALSNLYLPGLSQRARAASFTGTTYSFVSNNQELKITLTEAKDNEWWYEYYITVTNQSSQSICDWSIVLNCSNISAYSKAFECSGSKDASAGTLTVSGSGNNKVVAAGSTVSSSESFKLGFTSAVTFTGGTINYSYGSQSSVEDTAGGVGYGNTYLDGYSCKYNLTGEAQTMAYADTPVGKHGKLHVNGTKLTDEHNEPVILRGASTHGMHWGEMTPFVNKTAFQNLRDEWGVDMVRLVSYVTQGGYTQGSQNTLDNCIQNGVSYASELGMYAIIDWHIHAENPNDTKSQAITFFDKYSKMYADYDNIIYEICNEPTGTPWSNIKPYAEDVVSTIRANDPDAIIVVGTNTWSQDVDEVATNGGKIDDPNVMYTIHFYSGSHSQSLRDKVTTALNAGTPVFCTEFGICDASGNGGFNIDEANTWINFFEEKGISYSCWSLCNKDESASMISPQCSKKSGWVAGDLGATGAWLVNTYRDKRGDTPDATVAPMASAPASSQPSATSGSQTIAPQPTVAATLEPGMTLLADNMASDISYQPGDISWFTNGSNEDEITVTYTCTNDAHANWGIMGWGATVNGEWSDGKKYSAGAIASNIITETITIGELKTSLGITTGSTVSALSLNVYNGGRIIRLTVKEATATATPTMKPTATPTIKPTATPTIKPTATPTIKPTATPTIKPTATPTIKPTATPTIKPTATPTIKPTATPIILPTITPVVIPTATPTIEPTMPIATATVAPTAEPTNTPIPSAPATVSPETTPTAAPILPIATATLAPILPIATATVAPTVKPTAKPTAKPSKTVKPVATSTIKPTTSPTAASTVSAQPSTSPEAESTTKPMKTQKPKATATAAPAFAQKDYQVYVTEELTLEVLNPGNVTNITYSSSNINIAQVDENGVLQAKSAGVVTITSTLSNKIQITCQVTVLKPTVKLKKKTIVLKKKKSAKIQFKEKLDTDSIKKCKIIGKKVVKVTKKGIIKGLKKGKATIKITMKSGVVVKCKVRVR